jgi:predicted tellurium resistance membrane protein TerC
MFDFSWMSSADGWIALATLTVLEIVLGIDNIVFISILAGKLKPEERGRARTLGLGLAMGTRILLLLSITWVMGLTAPLFTAFDQEISGRDLILLLGGLFLIAKSTHEIHDKLEGAEGHGSAKAAASFGAVLLQIALLDIVFSLDSVITAVGMAEHIGVMVIAVVLAVGVMLFSASPISAFVEKHPTVKMNVHAQQALFRKSIANRHEDLLNRGGIIRLNPQLLALLQAHGDGRQARPQRNEPVVRPA